MNPLAVELNEMLKKEAPAVLEMMSDLGQRYYFPKGILSQSAEAKEKAHRYNATIGIALEGGQPMHLPCIRKFIPEIPAKDLFPYAPVAGKPELRERWKKKQLAENPRLSGRKYSNPVVTSALTHGLSLLSEMFVNPGDVILLPDQLWGNYRLTFEVRQGGKVVTFPFYQGEGFNLSGFKEAVDRIAKEKKKLISILNFPNNPTGYTPTTAEAEGIARTLIQGAEGGARVVAICDDAYFNLVYDDRCVGESLFGFLAGEHPNLLAVRLDGATKEQFVWGFRVGFLSYAAAGPGDLDKVHQALEKKTCGAIRAGISNSPHLSQSLISKAIEDPSYPSEQAQKRQILRARALRVKEVLSAPKYREVWEAYPFNSGYFMCLKLKTVDAEPLRLHLLDRYGLGVIATAKRDLRIAFSCLELNQLADVFETIYLGVKDLAP
ncbi:MAG: aminotransferase class I/II-fold pyridoxal phosphate-dependent enzyme [Planctomycetes bacterium]|nr:aminotransferase class I/II-fold pyridoxal phosphate-dependent enzyme [Planctomycetota bacterium]